MAKVLLVDDNRALRRMTTLILSEENECMEGSSAADCLQLLRSQQPDLLIADLLLPDENGLELFYSARALGYTGPVLLFTAADPESALVARVLEELGPDSLLLKPFEPEALLQRVNELLRRKQF